MNKILTTIIIGLFVFSFISYGYSYGLTTDNNNAINNAVAKDGFIHPLLRKALEDRYKSGLGMSPIDKSWEDAEKGLIKYPIGWEN